ncbi:MAG: cyclohexa-1,5-dienecarbonyl-CoA hydratase [bacterium]|nr:cyclohexa-1,5-dienecarbonyl-CoA hydratase [bacterium]
MTVRLEELEGGALWRVVLNTPKANIVDMEKTEELCSIFGRARETPQLKAVLVEGEGPHFSFGASVEEHLPDTCGAMLRGFHRLFGLMLEANVVTLAAVRGQCLGGGLELASFCNRLFAAPDARLGQPEIVLGVFAPVGSVVLAERVGRGHAEDLCLSGRSLTAEQALAIGLVDELADDPSQAALAYAQEFLLPRSASSLRMALRAVRAGFAERFRAELAQVERLYLEDLMSTADAGEGLAAFIEKRKPSWSNA